MPREAHRFDDDAGLSADELTVVPVRHPWRWVAVAVVGVLAAMLVHSLIVNPAWQWSYVRGYFTDRQILDGIVLTLELTALAMLIGIVLGVVLAIMRLSPNPVLSGASWTYIWFFRGTPVLVQILFWYNLPAVIHSLSLGVPFGPSWFHTDPKTVITQFGAAILGLGLNEAAYMAEIARAGILSVDEGQAEAAQAIGMTRAQTMQRIVLPQAMRVIIPPTGNETISMLKTTSLVFAIGYAELLTTAQIIYGRTFQTIPLLIVASIWYIFLTTVLSIGQYYLERYYARGSQRGLPPTPLQRVRARVGLGPKLNPGPVTAPLPLGQEHR
jgi:polar amino acid transport system permease protein